ncbi:MAG: TolC family protein [Blastocatellia bacterium]|nr:TolC family protein [Blastocatellia bacterium]
MNRSQVKRLFIFMVSLIVAAGFPLQMSAQAQAPTVDTLSGEAQAPPAQLTLVWLMQEALRRNPEIRAEMREVDAKRARIPQAGALPDPIVMFGQNNEGNIVPFTTLGKFDFSEVYLGFTQEFSLFGKRGLREQVASSEADAQWWEYDFTGRQVVANLKAAYYDLYYSHKAMEIVQKNIGLMENFAKIAEALYKVGKGNQADVLRANTEISRLEERLATLEQEKGINEARINALLNYPPETPLGSPAPVAKPPLTFSFEQLKAMAAENFSLLKRDRRTIDSRVSARTLAEKEKYPDFGFTFTYHNRGGLRDYWTIGGTATIPLYYSRKQRRAVDEAASEEAASRERYEQNLTLLFFKLKDAYLRATTSERLTRLYGEVITPQETLTIEATTAGYETGKIDFLSVVDSSIKLLNDELTYYEHLTKYLKALAELEPLIGVELTR